MDPAAGIRESRNSRMVQRAEFSLSCSPARHSPGRFWRTKAHSGELGCAHGTILRARDGDFSPNEALRLSQARGPSPTTDAPRADGPKRSVTLSGLQNPGEPDAAKSQRASRQPRIVDPNWNPLNGPRGAARVAITRVSKGCERPSALHPPKGPMPICWPRGRAGAASSKARD